jgi:hypothetical protein
MWIKADDSAESACGMGVAGIFLAGNVFVKHSAPKNIVLDGSGFIFWHGGMFWGRDTVAVGDIKTGLRLAEIAG